jgi:hypothetical protein
MKSSTFWDITPSGQFKVSRRFGETFCLNLQGRRVNQTRKQHEAAPLSACFMSVSCLAYSSILKMEAACFSETSEKRALTRIFVPGEQKT